MNDFLKNALSKNVYIVDNCGLYYFEDLRQELIKKIKGDILENAKDKEIVTSDLELLEKVLNINYGYNEEFIIKELSLFGVHIIKVQDILYRLSDFVEFFDAASGKKANDELAKKISDLQKELKEYFEEV